MSQLEPVRIDALPRSAEEFQALRDRVARIPQGGAAAMVVALLAFAEDEAVGGPMLVLAADRSRLQEAPDGTQGFRLRKTDLDLVRRQVKGKPHVLRSYFRGTSPASGYRLPPAPLEIAFTDNPYSGDAAAGPYKVFVACSGADSPRPVQVRKNDKGIWKASEWSSLIVGVKPPAPAGDDL